MPSAKNRILSIIIPVYNEEKTVSELLARVNDLQLDCDFGKEIIVVNDCSKDGSVKSIQAFVADRPHIISLHHDINQGKGAAIRSGLKSATGDYVIIQDADLELDPNDINKLLREAVEKNLDVVYGSRFLAKNERQKVTLSFLANTLLTWITGMLVNEKITDMETCYKLIRTDIIKQVKLVENRFGFEPEITMRVLRRKNVRFGEVSIYYAPRTQEEGKKIGWKDGVRALYCLIRYRFFA